jgi:hypothetical protein
VVANRDDAQLSALAMHQHLRTARATTSAGPPRPTAKGNVKEPAVRVTLALIKETFQISCEGKKIDESGD